MSHPEASVKLSSLAICIFLCLYPPFIRSAVFESVRGIVHDPDHRPVTGASVSAKSSTSDYSQTTVTGADGAFEIASLPVGAYRVTVTHDGFAAATQAIVVGSSSGPVLH